MRYDPDSFPMVLLGWCIAAALGAAIGLAILVLRALETFPSWL